LVFEKVSSRTIYGPNIEIINEENDKVINYVNYRNDPDEKIIKAGRLRSARNVDRMYDSELCKITGL
jgi:hypothetical protein